MNVHKTFFLNALCTLNFRPESTSTGIVTVQKGMHDLELVADIEKKIKNVKLNDKENISSFAKEGIKRLY